MTNHHHWFPSGPYSLLGHLDMPDEQPARSGVVIVPPFGWENICSYRLLRSIARSLAAHEELRCFVSIVPVREIVREAPSILICLLPGFGPFTMLWRS